MMTLRFRIPGRLSRSRTINIAIVGASLAVGLAIAPHRACAQNYAPSARSNYRDRLQRPTVSPYLNLYRNNVGGGFANYQTLVRPQLQQRAALNAQQRQIDQLQTDLKTGVGSPKPLPVTGHPSRFRYYSHYYGQRPTAVVQQ